MKKSKRNTEIKEWHLFMPAETMRVVICEDEDFSTAPVFGRVMPTITCDYESAVMVKNFMNMAITGFIGLDQTCDKLLPDSA